MSKLISDYDFLAYSNIQANQPAKIEIKEIYEIGENKNFNLRKK